MKTTGKIAIVLTVVFFICVITGSILTGVGGVSVLREIDGAEGIFEKIGNFISVIDGAQFNLEYDTSYVTFDDTAEVSENIGEIVLENLGGYNIEVLRGETSAMEVSFEGKYPDDLIAKYDIEVSEEVSSGGAEDVSDSSAQNISESDAEEVSGSDAANSPISFAEKNGVLTLSMESGMRQHNFFGINVGYNGIYGTVTIKLPKSYTGSLTISEEYGEIEISGISGDKLALSDCFGEVNIDAEYDMLVVDSCFGKIDAQGKIGGFEIKNCFSRVELELSAPLAHNSIIEENAGQISIQLADNDKVRVTSSDNMGAVNIGSEVESLNNGYVVEVTGNMGMVDID